MKERIIFLTILIFLSLSISSAIEFSCPKKVNINEEFFCNLRIEDLEGTWDVKVEILNEGKTIAKIFNPEKSDFSSAYYYLNTFISSGEEKEIKLKIIEAGEFPGTLKLRQEGNKETFSFEILVQESSNNQEKNEDLDENSKEEISKETKQKISENISSEIKRKNEKITGEIIILNDEPIPTKKLEDNELIYESKNNKVLRYSPYALIIFLIILLGFLLKDKT